MTTETRELDYYPKKSLQVEVCYTSSFDIGLDRTLSLIKSHNVIIGKLNELACQ